MKTESVKNTFHKFPRIFIGELLIILGSISICNGQNQQEEIHLPCAQYREGMRMHFEFYKDGVLQHVNEDLVTEVQSQIITVVSKTNPVKDGMPVENNETLTTQVYQMDEKGTVRLVDTKSTTPYGSTQIKYSVPHFVCGESNAQFKTVYTSVFDMTGHAQENRCEELTELVFLGQEYITIADTTVQATVIERSTKYTLNNNSDSGTRYIEYYAEPFGFVKQTSFTEVETSNSNNELSDMEKQQFEEAFKALEQGKSIEEISFPEPLKEDNSKGETTVKKIYTTEYVLTWFQL